MTSPTIVLGSATGQVDIYSSVEAAQLGMEHWQLKDTVFIVDDAGQLLKATVGRRRRVELAPLGVPAPSDQLRSRLLAELENAGQRPPHAASLEQLLEMLVAGLGFADRP